MHKLVLSAALVAGSLALGGCQTIFGRSADSSAQVQQLDASLYFASLLRSGEVHLRQGRPSRAAQAFRQASYHPDYAARAYNGMAIAYARMGRADLAGNYFNRAMQMDPSDPRYARNLARLQLGATPSTAAPVMLAGDVPASTSAPATQADSAPVASAAATGPIRVEPRTRSLVRVGAGEVHIASSSDATAPSPVTVHARQAVRAAAAQYPVRVALGEKQPQRPAVSVSTYPLRVELKPEG